MLKNNKLSRLSRIWICSVSHHTRTLLTISSLQIIYRDNCSFQVKRLRKVRTFFLRNAATLMNRGRRITLQRKFVLWCESTTNQGDKGWLSVDRNTRLLSYIQDLVSWLSRLQRIHAHIQRSLKLKIVISRLRKSNDRSFSKGASYCSFSKASGLEAFSRYPWHGSVSALAGRPTEYTIHVTQRFLSYWVGLLVKQPYISRIKLTCLATV